MNGQAKVLVTGGAGFIGSHLTERLLRDGKAVVVIDDLSTGRAENLDAVKNHSRLTLIRSKVSECKELGKIVADCESVYHLAAAVGVELVINSAVRSIETNLHETEIILDAVAEKKVPILLASTSEVYGKSTKPAFSEDDDLLIGPPKFSRWGYACSKLMDEFLALAFAKEKNVAVVVARLFNTVGPRQTGQYGMVLPRFIAAAKRGEPLRVYGDGKQTRCFCYVQDTVEALVRLQSSPAARNNIFNIGNPEEVSILELAKLVIELTKSKSTIELVPYEKAYAPGFEDMLRRKPVIEKLVKTTGFKPSTSLREIIQRTAS
jgi:UDP-glucose 4-epimerase